MKTRIRLSVSLGKETIMEVFFSGAILAILLVWIISVQRRLVGMDENINNAMSQIGVQLSSRFDALSALLDLTK